MQSPTLSLALLPLSSSLSPMSLRQVAGGFAVIGVTGLGLAVTLGRALAAKHSNNNATPYTWERTPDAVSAALFACACLLAIVVVGFYLRAWRDGGGSSSSSVLSSRPLNPSKP